MSFESRQPTPIPIQRSSYVSFWRKTRPRSFVYALAVFPVYLIGRIFPRKDLILFGSYNGARVGDNSWAQFTNNSGQNAFFVTKSKSEFLRLKDSYRVVYCYSRYGIWLQLRARKVYFSHTIDDFFAPVIIGATVVALGHGIPLKKSAAADRRLNWIHKPLLRFLILNFTPFLYHYYCNEVVSPHVVFDSPKMEVYGFSNPKLVRQQMPRITAAETPQKKTNKLLFAPTFRNGQSFQQTISRAGLLEPELGELIKNRNVELWVKPHYLDRHEALSIQLPSWVRLLDSDQVTDSLGSFEGLITDYSSIFYDSIVLGTPVAFVSHDLDEYSAGETELFDWFLKILDKQGTASIEEAIHKLLDGKGFGISNL
jgi:CDP-glycerol glycerophosphotransferase (TagB/SpsB family)